MIEDLHVDIEITSLRISGLSTRDSTSFGKVPSTGAEYPKINRRIINSINRIRVEMERLVL